MFIISRGDHLLCIFNIFLQSVSAAIIEGDIAVRTSGKPSDVSNTFFSDNPVRY